MNTNEHLDYELSEYIDGTLAEAELARVESHLAACAECRETLEDLRRLVRRAGSLDDRAPERDLWSGIAARIATESTADVVPLESRRRRVSFSIPQLAAAAVVLMAVSIGLGVSLTQRGQTAQTARADSLPVPNEGGVVISQNVNERVGRAVSSYETAIDEMRGAMAGQRGQLDTATIRVLEQSIRTIDSAIARAKGALARDPGNLYLNGELQRALDRKLDVLRQVTTLTAS